MKKITALLLALMMLAGILAGCGEPKDTGKAGKLKVVTTIFPEYDWVRAILGDKADNAEVTMLLDNGVDLHSYQPTADDIVKISDCDLFVYVGGESDGWVENALKNAANRNMKVINLLEALGDSVKTEETVEGMQEDDHGHGHSHDEQLTENDIKDRTLSDFAGAWKSLHPYLLNGDLDKFCQHRAEEDEDSSTTKDTYLEKFKASWQCDAEKISINGNTITFTYADGKTVSAEYTYAGYQPKLDDEGKIRSVRYQFETTSADAPQYVQFNDHGHEPGEAEHFHIYFGNDGFDALMSAKTNPFFVKDALSAEDILDELMGHDHGEEKDEHVWLSLKNAETLVGAISDALQELDPDNKGIYATNAAACIEKLSALSEKIDAAAEELETALDAYHAMSEVQSSAEFIRDSAGVPRCSCGGLIKPEVVLYEEGLDDACVEGAIRAISDADMLIVGGTSLTVYPAAGLIRYYGGSKLVLINRDETPYDSYANLIFRDPIGTVLSQVV